ncbi:Putative ribonuclease H protein At1g65750 [Linum perenne]
MMNSFWWGSREAGGGGGINWMRWERLCLRKDEGGMGFRALRGFNLAIVLKARYFPKGDFLSASLGNGLSYLWRSILASQVVTPRSAPLSDIVVRDLCVPGTMEWDMELIRDLFEDRDVREIASTAFGLGGTEDTRIWHFDKHGLYSVRSAYRVHQMYMTPRAEEVVPGEWRALWGLHVPPKMKNLLWRLARGMVPNRVRLRDRGIDVPPTCGVCSGEHEDDWHLYLTCSFAGECWEEAGLRPIVESHMARHISFPGWLGEIITTATDRICHRIVAIIWSLWKERNQRVWNRHAHTARWVVAMADEAIQEWDQVHSLPATRSGPRRAVCSKWHPPPAGRLKCNTDVALFSPERCTGMGMVLRDGSGRVIAFQSRYGPGLPSPREGEALTLLTAMRWMLDWGFSGVQFEVDSEEVFGAIRSSSTDVSEFGCVIRGCRIILESRHDFSIHVVRRNRNQVAHALARRSPSFVSPFVGYSSPMGLDTVVNDVCFDPSH